MSLQRQIRDWIREQASTYAVDTISDSLTQITPNELQFLVRPTVQRVADGFRNHGNDEGEPPIQPPDTL